MHWNAVSGLSAGRSPGQEGHRRFPLPPLHPRLPRLQQPPPRQQQPPRLVRGQTWKAGAPWLPAARLGRASGMWLLCSPGQACPAATASMPPSQRSWAPEAAARVVPSCVAKCPLPAAAVPVAERGSWAAEGWHPDCRQAAAAGRAEVHKVAPAGQVRLGLLAQLRLEATGLPLPAAGRCQARGAAAKDASQTNLAGGPRWEPPPGRQMPEG